MIALVVSLVKSGLLEIQEYMRLQGQTLRGIVSQPFRTGSVSPLVDAQGQDEWNPEDESFNEPVLPHQTVSDDLTAHLST